MPQPVDERMVNRQDPLLPSRCRRRHTTRLVHERMLDRAEVDLDRRQFEQQVVAKASNGRTRTPLKQDGHRNATVATVPDGSPAPEQRPAVAEFGHFCGGAAADSPTGHPQIAAFRSCERPQPSHR